MNWFDNIFKVMKQMRLSILRMLKLFIDIQSDLHPLPGYNDVNRSSSKRRGLEFRKHILVVI